jgi:hypothetical protein
MAEEKYTNDYISRFVKDAFESLAIEQMPTREEMETALKIVVQLQQQLTEAKAEIERLKQRKE